MEVINMAFTSTWVDRPGPWFKFRDCEVLDEVMLKDFHEAEGMKFENPGYSVKCVWDARNYYAVDLFQRIRMSALNNEKINIVFASPENHVFMSVVECLNKYKVSCKNVEVFFFDEFANEEGKVAPYESAFSKSGQWMKYFFGRLDPELRMPMEQIHFWTKENTDTYSDLLASYGGADVIYTNGTWSGLRFIDAETFPAGSMDEFLKMGSRHITLTEDQTCLESLRGMFGASGDLAAVPTCAVTLGPKDIMASKLHLDFEFLSSCDGTKNLQKPALQLAIFGPVCPENPGSMLRLCPGKTYISSNMFAPTAYPVDADWLGEAIENIRKAESGKEDK